MAAPSFATAKRSVKSVGTFSVVPMPHVACIAGSRVPIQLHVIRSTFLIDNLDPMSRMVVSRIGGASPKAGGFIGGRAGPLTDVALAEARESIWGIPVKRATYVASVSLGQPATD